MNITINISFPLQGITTIRTNAKRERVSDLLCDWVRAQAGQGEDHRAPADLDVYNIKISLDLSDDSFLVKSDTKNAGLTCGIIMKVIMQIDNEQVKWIA